MQPLADAPLIHDARAARRCFREMLASGQLRNAFRKPDELTIFTAHNYASSSLLEQSLDFLGIAPYTVIHKQIPVWSNSLRIRWFVDFLRQDCRTPLVLYCDADDVVVRGDLQRALDVFAKHNCDILYCSSRWPGGYRCMPSVRQWAYQTHPSRYLNGGVFIGKREFALEIYTEVLKHVTDKDTSHNPNSRAFYADELAYAAQFPRGVGCDQVILRYLEPRYHPRLQIDAANEFVWRNDNYSVWDWGIYQFKQRVQLPWRRAWRRARPPAPAGLG